MSSFFFLNFIFIIYNFQIDNRSHSIKKSEATGHREPTGQLYTIVVASSSDVSPFDLAIDVIGRLLFWTCSVQDVINVIRLDDSNPFGIMEKKEGEKPRLITIHATKRFVIFQFTDLEKRK